MFSIATVMFAEARLLTGNNIPSKQLAATFLNHDEIKCEPIFVS